MGHGLLDADTEVRGGHCVRTFLTYVLAGYGLVGCGTEVPADYPALPAFPVGYIDDSERPSFEELQFASESGDGWATLQLIRHLDCDAEVPACAAEYRELLVLSGEQGESVAPAVLRAFDASDDGNWRALATAGNSVCDQGQDRAASLLQNTISLSMPGYGSEPRDPEVWDVRRGYSDDSAMFYGAWAGPLSLTLVYEDRELKLARLMVNYLEIGSSVELGADARWEATRAGSAALAQSICPDWPGLDVAVRSYVDGVVATWPPRGVAAESSNAWLFATGVTPDIFWLDLYVDPRHNPNTSGLRWSFEEDETFALTELVDE